MSNAALELSSVTRHFTQAGEQLDILRGVNLRLAKGEMVALVGPSGSGKTTLLQIAGLLDQPSSGKVSIGGEAVESAKDSVRTARRLRDIGFIYQFHHLLPEFSALENVMMPQLIAGKSKNEAARRATELLADVSLGHRLSHRPAELSGGEQQRVAIARALANNPAVILADEPTGNLDPHTADAVFDLLLGVARGQGVAALIATHNVELARRMDRTVQVKDGKLA